MRTKYATNTTDELLSMADMTHAMTDGNLKELMAEVTQRLQEAVDEIYRLTSGGGAE